MQFIFKILLIALFPLQIFAVTQWNPKANFGGDARHRATAFTIGKKGYIGMGHVNSAVHIIYKDIWEYDPATNSWTQKADFGGGLRYQCAAFSIGDIAYMGLGRNPQNTYEKDFWAFNPLANMWYPIADFPGEERRGASGFTISGKGYVGLGQATSGYASDFYEYDPDENTWLQMADFIGAPRTSAVSFTHDGKAYVGTGHTWSAALKDFYEFTPSSNNWVRMADVGDTLRQDATGFTLNGNGYLGTGNNVDGSINYKDFWKYDFETDTWTQINDFRGSARRYMVSFVIGPTAYCGTGTNGTNLKDFWSFNPTLSTQNEASIHTLTPYPNPSHDIINFQIPDELINSTLIIYSIESKIVHKSKITNYKFKLNATDFEGGLYFFEFISTNSTLAKGKIVFTK